MSNLSDLLPAGAAAKQLTFTDSGSGISSKAPVVLNSDGTVGEISGQTFAIGTPGSMSAILTTWYIGVTYHTVEDKIVVLWIEDTSRDLYLQAGTVSGTSITWGSATLVDNGIYSNQIADICYDSNANCLNYSWVSSANVVRNECATLSGTTFTRDNSNTITVTSTAVSRLRQIFDPTNNKVALTLVMQLSTYGEFYSISISGTTPTASASLAWSGTSGVDIMDLAHDPDEQRVIIGFSGTGSVQGGVVLVDQSSSTPTASSISQYQATGAGATQVAYDTTNDKLVIGYYDSANSGYTSFIAGTVNASGGTVSFGTKTTTSTALQRYPSDGDLIFDPANNILLFSYVNGDTASPSNYGNYLLNLSLSGTTVSIDGQNVLDAATGPSDYWANGRLVFDPDNNKPFYIYRDVGNSNNGKGIVITPGFSNVTNFVGVADSAISASAAGSVIVQGGTVTGVNSGQGFTVGTPAAFGGGVAIGYPAMAYDTVHDKMVIAYQDQNNGSYGTAVVATISGSSISYGTQVVFESGGTEWIDVCFDPDQERVIIAYRDSPNSDYGTVIVGEVSGTSITFGSPVVYSTAQTQNVNCVYDTSNDKVVIVYYDVSNTQLNAVVGTVSGSSISLGTPTTIVANATWPGVKAVFDSTANKIVVVYANQTNGDSDGVVGTVSGTSISFGSIVQFESGSASPITAAYDASADKTLVVYADAGNSDYGTSVVASVSGTSISFTSPSVFETSQPGLVKSVYDATAQQTFIAYQDYSASYIGVAQAVSISGTTATFSGKTTLVDPSPSPFNLGYDPDNGKSVFVFNETTGQALVTSFGDLPLTVGTKYYVTTSGGFSSSADTPSVNAGLAISTTSLLLNGDS